LSQRVSEDPSAPLPTQQLDLQHEGKSAHHPEDLPAAWPDKEAGGESLQGLADGSRDLLPAGAIARLGPINFLHDEGVNAIALSPEGRTLASACSTTVRLWDVASGYERRRLAGPQSAEAVCLAWSADGKSLAAGWEDGAIVVWDAETLKERRRLTAGRGYVPRGLGKAGVGAVALSPDGRVLASRDAPGTIRIWDTTTGKELWRTASRDCSPCFLALSPDGKTLAAAVGEDRRSREVVLWETATGKEVRRLSHPWEVGPLVFSPDGKMLACGDIGQEQAELREGLAKGPKGVLHPHPVGELRLWDIASGKELHTLGGHRCAVRDVAFSADGRTLASVGEEEETVILWDVATGKERKRVKGEHPFRSALFSPDGKFLVTRNSGQGIRFWDVETGEKSYGRGEGSGDISALAFSPDSKSLVTAFGRTAVVWDLAARKEPRRFTADKGALGGISHGSNGQALVWSGFRHGSMALWEIGTGREMCRFDPKDDTYVLAMALADDGKSIASFHKKPSIHELGFISLKDEDTLIVRDVATGKERLHVHPPAVFFSLALSPGGKLLAAGSHDETDVRVWEAGTGKELPHLGNHKEGVWRVTFSPDGKLLATSDGEQTVRLWEVASGQERLVVPQENFSTDSLLFSPDGKLLTIAGISYRPEEENCGAIEILDVATGKEVHRFLEPHYSRIDAHIRALAFSLDGEQLATGGSAASALLWNMRPARGKAGHTPAELSPKELERLWSDLGGADAAKAHQAVWALASSPQRSLPFLQQHLRPVQPPDPKRVSRLLADLDSEEFKVREQAARELEKLGDAVRSDLLTLLTKKPGLEARRRVEQVLGALDGTHVPLREWRTLEVLELTRTAEAKTLLEGLSRGVPDARLTLEAKAALDRLARGQW
jgi:WD40 repeat protein